MYVLKETDDGTFIATDDEENLHKPDLIAGQDVDTREKAEKWLRQVNSLNLFVV